MGLIGWRESALWGGVICQVKVVGECYFLALFAGALQVKLVALFVSPAPL